MTHSNIVDHTHNLYPHGDDLTTKNISEGFILNGEKFFANTKTCKYLKCDKIEKYYPHTEKEIDECVEYSSDERRDFHNLEERDKIGDE